MRFILINVQFHRIFSFFMHTKYNCIHEWILSTSTILFVIKFYFFHLVHFIHIIKIWCSWAYYMQATIYLWLKFHPYVYQNILWKISSMNYNVLSMGYISLSKLASLSSFKSNHIYLTTFIIIPCIFFLLFNLWHGPFMCKWDNMNHTHLFFDNFCDCFLRSI